MYEFPENYTKRVGLNVLRGPEYGAFELEAGGKYL